MRTALRGGSVAREAVLACVVAAVVAALLLWAAPPGADLAAHLYQRWLYAQDGLTLWDGYWYAGRYSFITYSILYYPLAALVGVDVLAVASIAAAAVAYAVLVGREFGPAARWSSRAFAVVWAGIVLTAAFPFALGAALALLALCALQDGRRWVFAILAALSAAASPVAFVLLGLVTVGIGLGRRADRRAQIAVLASLLAIGGLELVLRRAFPSNGSFHFSAVELSAALAFCALGAALTWNVERARELRFVFVVYGAACVAAFLIPSAVGENIVRLRYLALPVVVLVLALRAWRPRAVVVATLLLAAAWNLSPLVHNARHGRADPSADAAYWQPAIDYLREHSSASYRVEAVDTTGHWPAFHLAKAGIPLVRGWFRQDDVPFNDLLYGDLEPQEYLEWLRRLGVRYVVLTDAPSDYSARAEATLIAGRLSPLRLAFRDGGVSVYEVPESAPMVTGPGVARVLSYDRTRIALDASRPGSYRVAARYSPYWRPSLGCVGEASDGMIRLDLPRAGPAVLAFDVTAGSLLRTLVGRRSAACTS